METRCDELTRVNVTSGKNREARQRSRGARCPIRPHSASLPDILPGDNLKAGALNVCLTFDDGYFDFYGVVFPLLVKPKLRALLAIPPGFVGESTDAKKNDRLNMEGEAAFADPSRRGFCTWSELKEMAGSGHVVIAAKVSSIGAWIVRIWT